MDKVVIDASHSNNYSSRKATAKEWRLFMSSRVSETLSHGASKQHSWKDDEANHEKEEFHNIFKEVQQLGISQMGWKQRKEIETQRRISLGAKPEKSHRMPISMGLNIKRKREDLENKKLQEDILLGRRSAKKGKKTMEKSHSVRGLKASEGIFKGGVLHVKPLTLKTEHYVRDTLQQSEKKKGKQHKKSKKGKKNGKKKRK